MGGFLGGWGGGVLGFSGRERGGVRGERVGKTRGYGAAGGGGDDVFEGVDAVEGCFGGEDGGGEVVVVGGEGGVFFFMRSAGLRG